MLGKSRTDGKAKGNFEAMLVQEKSTIKTSRLALVKKDSRRPQTAPSHLLTAQKATYADKRSRSYNFSYRKIIAQDKETCEAVREQLAMIAEIHMGRITYYLHIRHAILYSNGTFKAVQGECCWLRKTRKLARLFIS